MHSYPFGFLLFMLLNGKTKKQSKCTETVVTPHLQQSFRNNTFVEYFSPQAKAVLLLLWNKP